MLLPRVGSTGTHARHERRPASLAIHFALAMIVALLAWPRPVEAAPKKGKAVKAAKSKGDSKAHGSSEIAVSDAKVAVLAFEGDDAEPLRKHVIKVLVERGLKVNSTLKAQDNATQYRDMGAALNLAAYVHGKIKDTAPDHAVATVTIRSAVTGRPVATATFDGFRRGLPYDVEEKLWARVGPAFKRACAEAARGVRRHNEPLHIEAGTPL